MRKELGKWLMDIAKYIVTAVLLATVFGSLKDFWAICVFACVTVAITMSVGLWLIKDNNK